jgi:outer membrane protein TolC
MNFYHQTCLRVVLAGLLSTFYLPSVYAEPVTLTLPDCIQLALKNNPSIQIAEAGKEKAYWSVKQAQAYKGVTLGYNYMLGRTDQPPSWYNNTTGDYPLPAKIRTGLGALFHTQIDEFPEWPYTKTFWNHQFKLQVPLYTGGKIENTIGLAKNASAAADLGVDLSKQQLTLEVTTSYFNVLQARNLAGVAQQAVDDLSAHLTNVQNHYDAGTVALSHVLQTEVRLANAKNNLIKAQNAAKLTRYKLNKTIGLSLYNDGDLDDKFTYEPYTISLDDSIAAALRSRLEMTQIKLKIDMANNKIKIAQAEKLPMVAAVATETISDTNPSASKQRDIFMVGMNVSFNIFDNGLAKSQVQQANSELTVAKEQARQLEDGITLEVSHAYLSVQEAAERIKNNQVAVNKAKRDYEMAEERYDAGIGTNLDVMDAEVAMTQAKTNYVQALYDYNNSRAQLNKAMGLIK